MDGIGGSECPLLVEVTPFFGPVSLYEGRVPYP